MKAIPPDVFRNYAHLLNRSQIDPGSHADYRKWLRYFLDFREKYRLPSMPSAQIRLFTDKLSSKNQTAAQIRQASEAVSLFLSEMPDGGRTSSTLSADGSTSAISDRCVQKERHSLLSEKPAEMVCEPPNAVPFAASARSGRMYDEWRCLRKTASPAWDAVIDKLAAEIRVRHYSRKTLKHYADWTRKYQQFLRSKDPAELSSADVKDYLTHLAVDQGVSSSHQNLAFNSLLFLYRHVLRKDFGDHRDVPRAKRSNYIPTVLSRGEINAVFGQLRHPYRLVAQLQYGCGLRISEVCTLRAKDLDFEARLLSVRGKGNKVRKVPLPQRLVPELQAHMNAVRDLHDADLKAGFAGVFLDDLLEKKYPRAAKELIWQWFFPQESLTFIPRTKELRRYHIHDSRVQEALYEAVRRAKLTKRVTTHTLRHSFATHLLQANYDIRTIQTLLGHSDVRTTMIYTHCVPSRTLKELKSPLDF